MKRPPKHKTETAAGWRGLHQWRQDNREALIAKFTRHFGNKLEEWPDFVEGEFAAFLGRRNKC